MRCKPEAYRKGCGKAAAHRGDTGEFNDPINCKFAERTLQPFCRCCTQVPAPEWLTSSWQSTFVATHRHPGCNKAGPPLLPELCTVIQHRSRQRLRHR